MCKANLHTIRPLIHLRRPRIRAPQEKWCSSAPILLIRAWRNLSWMKGFGIYKRALVKQISKECVLTISSRRSFLFKLTLQGKQNNIGENELLNKVRCTFRDKTQKEGPESDSGKVYTLVAVHEAIPFWFEWVLMGSKFWYYGVYLLQICP